MSNEAAAWPRNPWLSLWFRPRSAIDAILSRNRWGVAIGVYLLGTIASALVQLGLHLGLFDEGWSAANFGVVALVALAAAIWAGLFYFIDGWVVNAIARAFGGKGTAATTRIAFGWSTLPIAITSALALASMLLGHAPHGLIWRGIVIGALFAAGAWSYVLAIAMLSRVQRSGVLRSIFSLLIGFLALLAIALLIRSLALQSYSTPSTSMTPTLQKGDYFFASKSAYGYGKYSFPFGLTSWVHGRILGVPPKRGDLVVFRNEKTDTDYVKRIIGMPGERIQMRNARLFIDGRIVERRAVESPFEMRDPSGKSIFAAAYDEALPDRPVHRIIQLEGDEGPLSNTEEFVTPPDAYFVMGDNRDNSLDSRSGPSGGVGFATYQNLIGKAELIYYSVDEGAEGQGSNPRLERILRWVE
jgi:signal peptidase I